MVAPGTRLYFYSKDCAQPLGLESLRDWQNRVLLEDGAGHVLSRELTRLLDAGQQAEVVPGNLSLLGLQWREQCEPVKLSLAEDEISQLASEFALIARDLNDQFSTHEHACKLGEFLSELAFSAVADTVTIGILSNAVRRFTGELAYTEETCYHVDLAVSEALTNILLHGFRDRKPRPTRLIVLAFQHAVAVLIEDEGNCIPDTVLDKMRYEHSFQDDLSLAELPEGGMGLAFMRMVSRRFVYQAGEYRNRLLLIL